VSKLTTECLVKKEDSKSKGPLFGGFFFGINPASLP